MKAIMKKIFKILVSIPLLLLFNLVYAQVTIPFNSNLGPSQYIDITPVGGFAAGTTLSSFSITLTSYVPSGNSYLDDLAVVVAPATPTSANAVFATNNMGGLTAPSMAGWTPSLAVPGTGAVNLTTPISLVGMKLWIGNSYAGASGTWAGSFTYPSILATPAPTVTSITPVQGPTTGGTSISITGSNLTGATAITVGGAACSSFNVSTATSATCTTPIGTAGTASVLVTTPGGTNAANTLFTYVTPVPAPAVTSVSPNTGPTSGGTVITITGTDLTGATAITVGGVACTSFNVTSATSATCTTPTGTAGTASVLVTTAGGTNAANTLFTFFVAPIPTLSEWAMIFMASLMAMFAIRRIRRNK